MKLSTLLFGLLLAVGWTSSASAQSSPNNHSDAVHPKSYYDALTYTWENPNDGEGLRTSKSTDLATDPYQIYELLRFVYGNPAFPGPKYAGYNYDGTVREDPVSYGPIRGCWNIVAASNPRDITINISQYSARYPVLINSIEVRAGNNAIDGCSWTYNSITGRFAPTSWNLTTGDYTTYGNSDYLYFRSTGGTITIPAGLLEDYTDVQVVIRARSYDTDYSDYKITVNGSQQTLTSTSYRNYTWNVTLPAKTEIPFVKGTVATPYEDGYTALMVSVYDDAKKDTSEPSQGSYFSTVQQFINYITPRIKSVQLLTDGLRIGSVEEQTSGTVFNCSGTYNKFFIIGKGQAREKSDLNKNDAYGNNWEIGEAYPFQTMFEQFSPTTTDKDADIKDFYTEMQDGHVYSVVHDCGTILQEEHQFSMSGNTGTQSYAMSGLNFFIPDYRLKFWTTKSGSRTVDGRDITPYQTANSEGKDGGTFSSNSNWHAWWANYNPTYAPKIGIYKITLEATAKKAAGYDIDDPDARQYDVTLNWVSSLNELSGEMVPQTYIIYTVTYNEDGTETQTPLDTVYNETTYTYQVPQGEESQTITYIIKGYPTPGDELQQPSFVAWSNLDDVVIPGLNDFLNLILDHYESDFIIGDAIGTEKNYYRNFMHVAAENEDNALTVERINAGEKIFTLYRYDATKPFAETTLIPIGELNFWDNHDGKTVGYGFSFKQGTQDVESYDIHKPAAYNEDHQLIHPAIDIDNAYSYDKLGMPINQSGFDLRIKGNGDIVIQPNGYDVNFYEISVYNESNTRVAHWQVSNGNVTSLGWYLSPGSKWVRDTGTDYYYLEGGGFIAIPNMLNNNQLRVVINASRDAGKLGQIKVNDHTLTVNSTSAQNYEWTLTDKYYKYVRVLNSNELTAGEYLIVNEDENVIFDGSKGVLDAAYNNLNVDILKTGDTHEIFESALIDNATFTIDPAAGTVKSASGFYIGLTANSNGLRQSTEPIINVISVDGIEAHIKNQTATVRELRYNASSGATGKRFRYYPEGTQQAIQLYKKVETTKPVGESIVRLGSLPIIDQFSVSVADNLHPNRYGYVLKYVPGENVDPTNQEAMKPKTSSHIEVPVQKTGSVINGFYTEAQVAQDKDQYNTVKVDNVTADMQMTLSNTNSAIFYYSILNKKEAVPHITADSVDYVSNLQNDNFVYQEMFKHSPNINDRYNAGEHHYFDGKVVQGEYGDMGMTYVPFITTRAIERFYFVEDSLHNTYGSPIWATSAGKVEIVGHPQLERQVGKNGSTNWEVINGDDTTKCSLFMIKNLVANGFLPDITKSNIDYEPYLFRVWITSPSGKLRKFKKVTTETSSGYQDDGPIAANTLYWLWDQPVYEEPTSDFISFPDGNDLLTQFNFTKQEQWEHQTENPNDSTWVLPESANMIFAAPDDLTANDIKIIVRFYYKSTGKALQQQQNGLFLMGNRDGEKSFYGAEDPNGSPDPRIPTFIKGIYDLTNGHGEVIDVSYFNLQGMKSDKPFDGINIVITRYSDGTTSTTKVVR